MKSKLHFLVRLLAAISLSSFAAAASAGVIQRVTTFQGNAPLIHGSDPGGVTIPAEHVASHFSVFGVDEIFGATSADITTEISASISGRTLFGRFSAISSADRFGSVGLSSETLQEIGGNIFTGSHVVIASDEIVNLTGS